MSFNIIKVFFFCGEYLVNGNIVIVDLVEFYGMESGMVVIKVLDVYVIKIYNVVRVLVINVVLRNLYFDGIFVEFKG